MTKSRNIAPPRRRWTDDEIAILRDLFPNHRTEDVATMIGRSTTITAQKANNIGLRKSAEYLASPASGRLLPGDTRGLSGRIQPGQTPWNKGIKFEPGGRSAETRFKAGLRPHNTRAVGDTKLTKDGTLVRKISDATGKRCNRWRAVHELVWTEANGPLPPKHIVVFRPGMATAKVEEITLDRVECISLAENMRRNTVHNYPPEIARLLILRGALNRQINKRSST